MLAGDMLKDEKSHVHFLTRRAHSFAIGRLNDIVRVEAADFQDQFVSERSGKVVARVRRHDESCRPTDDLALINLHQPGPAIGSEPRILNDGERIDDDMLADGVIARDLGWPDTVGIGIIAGNVDHHSLRLAWTGREHLSRPVDAIADRDVTAAGAAMDQHLQAVEANLLKTREAAE